LGSFRQSLAFFCTAKALADFLAEVLEHESPPRLMTGGSTTGLSASDACRAVTVCEILGPIVPWLCAVCDSLGTFSSNQGGLFTS
jgi:hypothetical protein